VIGIAVGGLLVLGGGIFFVMQRQAEESRQAAERAAHLAAEKMAQEVRDAQKKAADEAKKAAAEVVFLSVVSEPLGAVAEATWPGGVKAAATPFDLQVPKNAKVHFAFSKPEFLPSQQDIVADSPQVVKVTLVAEPKKVVARPPLQQQRPNATRAKAKSSKDGEDTIPVEF
jgi:hypothetical protein